MGAVTDIVDDLRKAADERRSAPPPRHWPLPEGKWWACSEPERLDDGDACFKDECEACWIAFEASARLDEPDRPLFRFDPTHRVNRKELMVEARIRNMGRLKRAGALLPEDDELRRVR